ncbi:MAG: hypothetical protein CTY28_10280 [Hyphomicrobium sp.]|nr:MAG: hypothetical protein CTY28_10280 [Hyphomicrobium sp.]
MIAGRSPIRTRRKSFAPLEQFGVPDSHFFNLAALSFHMGSAVLDGLFRFSAGKASLAALT